MSTKTSLDRIDFKRCPMGEQGCALERCPDCLQLYQTAHLHRVSEVAAETLAHHAARHRQTADSCALLLDVAEHVTPDVHERINGAMSRLLDWARRKAR